MLISITVKVHHCFCGLIILFYSKFQTLYTYPENFRAYKALVAAQYSGAKIKVVSSPPDFKFGETNKSAEFLKKFPTGKVRVETK